MKYNSQPCPSYKICVNGPQIYINFHNWFGILNTALGCIKFGASY